MNILLLCKRRYTNKDLILDRFGRLYHFPKSWRDKGHTVTVVALDYFSFKNSLHDIDSMQFHSLGFPSLGFDFLSRVLRVARNLGPDLVIGSGDSHLGFLAVKLASRLNVPGVFDLYHHYADFGSNRIPGMKPMYFNALRNADLVVCDSEPLRDKVQDYNRKLFVAPQGTDPALFRPIRREQAVGTLNLDPEYRYIGYTGSLDSRFDHDCLLEAIKTVRKKDERTRLLIAGKNTCNYDLGETFIDYLGELPQELIPLVINACDVMCIPYRLTDLASTCNPCKLSEYIFCGIPIVASAVSSVKRYLPASRDLCYTPGNSTELATSIMHQMTDPIRESRHESLTWMNIGNSYLEELCRLTDV